MNKKIYGFAFSALALGMLASCSNDVKNSPAEPNSPGELPAMQLAQAPDLVIWSGSNTLATKGEGETTTTTEGNKTNKYDYDEVEVNLAIQDVHYLPNGDQKYDIKDLVSHLSIHVRTATDVTVTIPVGKDIYCDQDDLYIYKERNVSDDWVVTTAEHETKAKVGGKDVTLKVTFGERNIVINTTGIDQDVINACKEETGDGINFDVYNYYNRANQSQGSFSAWKLNELKAALDGSTIELASENNVEFYINAFTGTKVDEILEEWVGEDFKFNEEDATYVYNEFFNPTTKELIDRDCKVLIENMGENWKEVRFDTEKHPELLNKVWQNKNYPPAASTGGVTGGENVNND